MASPFIGQVMLVGFNFNPRGWAQCDGQVISIAQNTALFSLLGTTYGGNGQTTFALPDLRGRAPLHPGQGPGLSSYVIGERGGAETVALNSSQMPQHTHPITNSPAPAQECSLVKGAQASPVGAYPAISDRPLYGEPDSGKMASALGGLTGNGSAHANRQPYLAVNFIIALQGVYPSRP